MVERAWEDGGSRGPAADVDSPWAIHARALSIGRDLLRHFDVPIVETSLGISTVMLPTGEFGLLLLGIPVPVFSYMGDGDQVLQRGVVHLLKSAAGTALRNGRRVELHSFSCCFGVAPEGDVLDLLQSFGALDGARRARYLGVQLVTVLPLGKDEISTWPHGPSDVCRIVDRFLGVLPMMYWKLDRDLVRVHDSRRTEGDEGRSLWIGDSSG